MFTLPADFPLEAFLGRRIERVYEGSHYVEVDFQESASGIAWMRFEGPVVLRLSNGSERRVENAQLLVGNSTFQLLLNEVVENVTRLSEQSCRFVLSGGSSLDLIGEKGLESYHLGVAGRSCDV
jgi:hypothetical protein